jgi:hypothetical protein
MLTYYEKLKSDLGVSLYGNNDPENGRKCKK